MAQTTRPDPANGNQVLGNEYEDLAASYAVDGVIGTPADTAVVYADSSGRQVKIRLGKKAQLRGRLWKADPSTDEVVTTTTNVSGNPRIDRLVLRYDRTTGKVTTPVLVGTPGAVPVAPTLTQTVGTSGVWEFPLARWQVASGYTTIAAGDIVVEHWYTHPSGLILCNSTTRPFGAYLVAHLRIAEYDTGLQLRYTGSTWVAPNTPDIQTFTANGTWTKPTGATTVQVVCVGGGGAGGSGRRGASATVRGGGGGGGGGGVTRFTVPASALPSTVGIQVGLGGTGGAAVAVNDTNGNNGGDGGDSMFGTTGANGQNYGRAYGGNHGGGGSTSAGSAGTNGFGMFLGAPGATGSVGAGVVDAPFVQDAGAGGGGGGGGISAANALNNGGGGGYNIAHYPAVATGGTANGAAGASNGASGASLPAGLPGNGGGGGGANSTLGATGATGGTGGAYGAGGGGGGAALNGNSSGKGGDGGNGVVIVTTFF